ncbi:MAG: DUF3786 domain-containing protein [Desulfobacterales bacterium]
MKAPGEPDGGGWEAVRARDPAELARAAAFDPAPPGGLVFRFLGEPHRVDLAAGRLFRLRGADWEPADDPLLEVVLRQYLRRVRAGLPAGGPLVGVRDLREGHFFRGPHALDFGPLLSRYGCDPAGFAAAAGKLGAEPVAMADCAFRFRPLPRVPVTLLLWTADEEFPARMTALFERTIEEVLPADAIWALVTRTARAVLEAGG